MFRTQPSSTEGAGLDKPVTSVLEDFLNVGIDPRKSLKDHVVYRWLELLMAEPILVEVPKAAAGIGKVNHNGARTVNGVAYAPRLVIFGGSIKGARLVSWDATEITFEAEADAKISFYVFKG